MNEAGAFPIPERIGRYRVLCELGQGGMAVVYLARAVGPGGFERLFALKMIHEHLCRDQAFVKMFLNEARLAARINHPHVVSVYEVDVDRGRYFIGMDYVTGESLSFILGQTWKKRRALPIGIALGVVAGVCEGLHAAHEIKSPSGEVLGLVHRDISPQNILLGYDGIPKIMDFGLAKALDQIQHTRPGALKGTIAYMSPEQLRNKQNVDRRSDVFALGVVLWESTVGKRLFKGPTDIETAARVLKLKVPRPSEMHPEYPKALEEIVMKALERDPDRRYASARDLGRAISDFLLEARVRISAAELEQFMTATFPERKQQRLEMEQQAADTDDIQAPAAPESSDPDPSLSLADVNLEEDLGVAGDDSVASELEPAGDEDGGEDELEGGSEDIPEVDATPIEPEPEGAEAVPLPVAARAPARAPAEEAAHDPRGTTDAAWMGGDRSTSRPLHVAASSELAGVLDSDLESPARFTRGGLIGAGAGIFAAIGLIAYALLDGPSEPAKEAPQAPAAQAATGAPAVEQITITFAITPAGATVSVNGRPETPPIRRPKSSEKLEIEIAAPGYETQKRVVTAETSSAMIVNLASLSASAEKAPAVAAPAPAVAAPAAAAPAVAAPAVAAPAAKAPAQAMPVKAPAAKKKPLLFDADDL